MNGILIDWFYNTRNIQENVHDNIVASLFENNKVTKYSYSIFKVQESPTNTENYWLDVLDIEEDIDWSVVHDNNFTCSIETQLRAFYFKIFHRAICTNKFLNKIGRKDSPFCYFCKNSDETLVHLFCECSKVTGLWENLSDLTESKIGERIEFSNYQKMFGIDLEDSEHKNIINYLILCIKFYIYRCKFQEVTPCFQGYKNMLKIKVNTEYKIAEGRGKLGKHFKKFSFDLDFQ